MTVKPQITNKSPLTNKENKSPLAQFDTINSLHIIPKISYRIYQTNKWTWIIHVSILNIISLGICLSGWKRFEGSIGQAFILSLSPSGIVHAYNIVNNTVLQHFFQPLLRPSNPQKAGIQARLPW